MKKSDLLKLIITQSLSFATFSAVAITSTSCDSKKEEIIHVESVDLDKTGVLMYVGDTEVLAPTIYPTGADESVEWTSSNENVATIDQNGKITAVSAGHTKITVTSIDNSHAFDTCDVTVTGDSQYVVINADADSTLTLNNVNGNNPNLCYSFDSINWNIYSDQISISTGQSLYLKGNNPKCWSESDTKYSNFVITGDVSISGSVMGLLDNGTKSKYYIPSNYCFNKLFANSKGITGIYNKFLPATILTDYCYHYMFYGCTSLKNAPELPATTLATNCYSFMFDGCSDLTVCPKLLSRNLADECYLYMFANCKNLITVPNGLQALNLKYGCYTGMFQNCSSLTITPDLPAKELSSSCYKYMFSGCTSLTEISTLPAIALATDCCSFMFDGCVSLKSAPDLLAKTLVTNCYYGMFNGCTSLTKAPKLPATTLAIDCYSFMFDGCTSLTKAPDLLAKTLAYNCYSNMFFHCTSLSEIRLYYEGVYDSNYFNNWVQDGATTGIFYYRGNQSAQDFGFPNGWIKENF